MWCCWIFRNANRISLQLQNRKYSERDAAACVPITSNQDLFRPEKAERFRGDQCIDRTVDHML